MKITSNKKNRIFASGSRNLASLRQDLEDILNEDICIDIVNLAYSEDIVFEDKVFTDADAFWDIHSADDAKELVLQFFNGEDLDSRGSANPNRKYFRVNKYDNIESTDYPGEIYLDKLTAEIVDYIMEHLDDREYPDEVQEIIDNYFDDKE